LLNYIINFCFCYSYIGTPYNRISSFIQYPDLKLCDPIKIEKLKQKIKIPQRFSSQDNERTASGPVQEKLIQIEINNQYITPSGLSIFTPYPTTITSFNFLTAKEAVTSHIIIIV
jgi:hypothetical protein